MRISQVKLTNHYILGNPKLDTVNHVTGTSFSTIDFVKSLPLQNRATLSKYVARRKMVIVCIFPV